MLGRLIVPVSRFEEFDRVSADLLPPVDVLGASFLPLGDYGARQRQRSMREFVSASAFEGVILFAIAGSAVFGVVALFRNEHAMPEWLQHHHDEGATEFVLCDDNSTDPSARESALAFRRTHDVRLVLCALL